MILNGSNPMSINQCLKQWVCRFVKEQEFVKELNIKRGN